MRNTKHLNSNILESHYASLKTKAAHLLAVHPCSKTNARRTLLYFTQYINLVAPKVLKLVQPTRTSADWCHNEALTRLQDTTAYIPYITPKLLPELWKSLRGILEKHNLLYAKNKLLILTTETKYIFQQENVRTRIVRIVISPLRPLGSLLILETRLRASPHDICITFPLR
jgi:hypothetical protein